MNKKKMPSTVWIIADDVSGDLWGTSGWFRPPGDLLMFTKEEIAQKEFDGMSGRLFGVCIKQFILENGTYIRTELL